MNLIEKYGSYDAAKAKQQELSKIAADPQLLLVGKIIKEIGEIEIALLEYRRQHNIFEAGDKVVLSGGNCTLMYKLHERIGKYVYLKRPSGREYEFRIDDIRHATDAEIEAGKRLEVESDS